MKVNLYALHGFLGHPSDWDFLTLQPLAIDIYADCHPQKGLWNWAHLFNHHISHNAETLNVLLGYSLGGRLALHALLDEPSLWDAAIIVSAHPGILDKEERKRRKAHDKEWSRSFLEAPWDEVIERWNTQETLRSSINLPRDESNYSREKLALALVDWSLGNQDAMHKKLERLYVPIQWLAGSQDLKFAQLAHSMTLAHPLSSIQIVEEAGHRLPWDKPVEFQALIDYFIYQVYQQKESYAESTMANR